MREIKFRAFQDDKMYYQKSSGVYATKRFLDTLYEDCELMQFTGLKDKNGKEIFEGDILDFDEREWGGKFEPEVIQMENLIGDWNYCGSLSDVTEWRCVIGNIYETPEQSK